MTEPGTLIAGRYRLLRELAAGGMGTVWLAHDDRLERQVALKMLHPQPGLTAEEAELVSKRAMREARLTARLHHPHAVPVYDVVEHDGQPCLIMQYLPSSNLQAVVEQSSVLPPAEVARIGAQLASALAAAHEAGIVHRDVKPGNVLIAEDGTAKLTDFGVSHALGDVSLTSTGMVTGTPAFLAPEVARGTDSSFSSDVYSLGATLYAATEGDPPFGTGQNPMATLHKVASGRPNPPTRSGPLTPLLVRMLAADPADRPPMLEVARTLKALQADIAAAATRPARRAPAEAVTAAEAAAGFANQGTDPTAVLAAAPPSRPVVPPAGPARPPAGRPPLGPSDRNSKVPLVAVLTALVVIVALVLAIVLLNQHKKSGTAAPNSPAKTGSSHAASSTPPASSRPPSSSAASTPASSTAATSAGTVTAAQLARAITDYYKLLPEHTDQAWARLTARYQSEKSLGRQNYQNFWDSIERVSASGSTGTLPGTVEATIHYTFKDGRSARELTRFGLVNDGGVLKIDTSTVLSSG